eukprot:1161977-Pelagomonas_calceolata.AAC.3
MDRGMCSLGRNMLPQSHARLLTGHDHVVTIILIIISIIIMISPSDIPTALAGMNCRKPKFPVPQAVKVVMMLHGCRNTPWIVVGMLHLLFGRLQDGDGA